MFAFEFVILFGEAVKIGVVGVDAKLLLVFEECLRGVE